MKPPVLPSRYDADYFEHGPIAGVSGYMNYSWMPERTLRLAHKLIQGLPIKSGERVLDFGCAKGFLVKALRILDVDAWGVDVSEYAIAHADAEVRRFCNVAERFWDVQLLRYFDWMIAKDVLEHLTEQELGALLTDARQCVARMFVAVPLGDGDRFVVPAYDNDVTHRLAKPVEWWEEAFDRRGWHVDAVSHEFAGCKDDWTARYPLGNAFFMLSKV